MNAASQCRAVEIAGSIEDQAGVGMNPVAAVVAEAVQHLLRPAAAPLGDNSNTVPAVVNAAIDGRAVEIAGGIERSGPRKGLPASVPLPKLYSTFSV